MRGLGCNSCPLCAPELTSEYAATRKQFNRSLSEFGMIQVRRRAARRPFPPRQTRATRLCGCAVAGEVCCDGSECLCDGEHGLHDGWDDGQTREA